MDTRIIIAIDQRGVHLRETVCTIDRGDINEVHYHTRRLQQPAWSGPVLSLIGILARLMIGRAR